MSFSPRYFLFQFGRNLRNQADQPFHYNTEEIESGILNRVKVTQVML